MILKVGTERTRVIQVVVVTLLDDRLTCDQDRGVGEHIGTPFKSLDPFEIVIFRLLELTLQTIYSLLPLFVFKDLRVLNLTRLGMTDSIVGVTMDTNWLELILKVGSFQTLDMLLQTLDSLLMVTCGVSVTIFFLFL